LTGNDAPPSVNDLISSLRKLQAANDPRSTATSSIRPTLPPNVRNLLSIEETPAPAPRRGFRRYDDRGRLLPPGPDPPRSWLEPSQVVLEETKRQDGRIYPNDIEHLPSLSELPQNRRRDGTPTMFHRERSLQDMCLRAMARNWIYVEDWERNNLADLPTRLRMSLLSYIAVYGSHEGITLRQLKTILLPPVSEYDVVKVGPEEHNDGFYRLDLSGSVGRSISLNQIKELVQEPTPDEDENTEELGWEDSISRTVSPTVPHLTHLSLSHPASEVSWQRLLQLSTHLPTLTHLSLAYWPTPSLTPNSKTAVMSAGLGRAIQYGATNYYSHSLDDDYRESANLLRNLASKLYSLEYLDLTGCTDWIRALRWQDGEDGIDWASQWVKLRDLKVYSGIVLSEDSKYEMVDLYSRSVSDGIALEKMMPQVRKRKGKSAAWIQILRDDHKQYEDYWKHAKVHDIRRQRLNQIDLPTRSWHLTTWQLTQPGQRSALHDQDSW